PCPVTIRFTPDGSGGYDVARTVPQWFDDSALGTEIAAGGLLPADTMSPAQALGFAFTMPGGGSTTAVHVDDNGRVVADPAATSSSSPIPGTMRLGPAVIAPYWTDLDSAGGSVRFHADPQAGFATITWRDVPQAGAANALTFQLRLESDGSFAFTYLDARDWQQPAGNYTNNVVVGCSGGNGVADPGASDFAVYPIASGGSSMVYQTWTATNAPQHVDLQAHLHLTRFGVIGGALEFELGGLTSVSAAAFLVLGLQDPGIEFTALLTGIPGLTGCVQHASPDLVTLMLLNGGTATGSFAIPASPSLVGLPLQAQTAAVAPGESLLGVVLSDALRVTIGG
ncbi:MAG: hypothetical protein KDE27_01595, partial [Planctomycetes bacterium]|nr:hypothetical protein [Planctomycetota bacterium]